MTHDVPHSTALAFNEATDDARPFRGAHGHAGRTGAETGGLLAFVAPPRRRITLDTFLHRDNRTEHHAIRCPMCSWEPQQDSLWRCSDTGVPEFHSGCGTVWNTFSTGGRCPGCRHRWQWTLCPRCSEWSPHEDWYADAPPGAE